MCMLLIWYGSFWHPLRPQQPPNSLGGQNRVCRRNWWPQFAIWPSFKPWFQGIFISQKMTLLPGGGGDDKHDPLTCVASPQVTIYKELKNPNLDNCSTDGRGRKSSIDSQLNLSPPLDVFAPWLMILWGWVEQSPKCLQIKTSKHRIYIIT